MNRIFIARKQRDLIQLNIQIKIYKQKELSIIINYSLLFYNFDYTNTFVFVFICLSKFTCKLVHNNKIFS